LIGDGAAGVVVDGAADEVVYDAGVGSGGGSVGDGAAGVVVDGAGVADGTADVVDGAGVGDGAGVVDGAV